MKKIVMMVGAFLAASMVFAYNPPLSGENIFKLTNPTLLGGSGSATGGPFGEVIPESIVFNPALPAYEERTAINLSASLFIDSNNADINNNMGWGFQGGVIIPTKWMVFSAAAEGIFSRSSSLDLGENVVAHIGLSKEILEDTLSLGLNGYFGYFFGNGNDFIAGADLGAMYKIERLGFMKDVRIGVAMLNMGKPLSGEYAVKGLDGTSNGTSFPGIFTPRLSFAGELFSLGTFPHKFTGAFSVDAYFPTFQNAVFDMAFGLSYNKVVNLTASWEANVREIASTKRVNWPAIGLGFHIVINRGDDKDSREQTEMIPALAWQNINGGIQDLSVGATVYIGMTDNEAPKVSLWGDQFDFVDSDE